MWAYQRTVDQTGWFASSSSPSPTSSSSSSSTRSHWDKRVHGCFMFRQGLLCSPATNQKHQSASWQPVLWLQTSFCHLMMTSNVLPVLAKLRIFFLITTCNRISCIVLKKKILNLWAYCQQNGFNYQILTSYLERSWSNILFFSSFFFVYSLFRCLPTDKWEISKGFSSNLLRWPRSFLLMRADLDSCLLCLRRSLCNI